MQPSPPAQPDQQPAGSGWGPFWLGVMAGGCGVVVLQAVAAVLLLFVVGAAVGSVMRQAGGGLPAAIPVPSGISTRSDPCSPQPCVARGGLTVLVANVDHDAGPASDGRAHLVKLDVTFVDGSGTHTVTPEEVALRDSSGAMLLPGMDAASARCGSNSVSEDLQAGQRAGPYTVCYAVGDPPAAPLTLVWVDPEDLALIELKLP